VLTSELPCDGLLSRRFTPIYGQGKRQYNRLLTSLQRDLDNVGTLEEVVVEKIPLEYWRLGVVAWHAAEAFEKENPFSGHSLPANHAVSDNESIVSSFKP
jgi:hypothetical protein